MNTAAKGQAHTYFTVVYCYHIMLIFVTTGKRNLERHRRRWEDNIKMDVQEVGCGGKDWIDLAEDRDRWWAVVNAIRTLGFHKMW
jgi:hypothetical protein